MRTVRMWSKCGAPFFTPQGPKPRSSTYVTRAHDSRTYWRAETTGRPQKWGFRRFHVPPHLCVCFPCLLDADKGKGNQIAALLAKYYIAINTPFHSYTILQHIHTRIQSTNRVPLHHCRLSHRPNMTNIPSIQYASTEAASANASTTLVHASKLITELRLREDKIEALERRNQELITLRDR